MSTNSKTERGPWDGLALGQVLALGALVACLWWIWRELELLFASHPILPSIGVQMKLGTVFFRQLASVALAAWLLHALLGLTAFGLARLTEAAFPRGIGARREWLIAGWFALLSGLVMVTNTTWHPASLFAGDESAWRSYVMSLHPVQLLTAGIAVIVAGFAIRARPLLRLLGAVRSAPVAAALIALVILWLAPMIRGAFTATSTSKPHVVIIGIDSLRNDLTVPRRGDAALPEIRTFIEESRRFNDVVSPLPRTYGAWVSILTGRHPVRTNARVNLMPRKLVNEGDTLADALRAQGYQTLYATDEVRFANFDRSFGFDQLITPPAGAADFLLGYAGDMPLLNLVASTPLGAVLLPSHHANRAAYVTYRPGQFLRRLEREMDIDGPTFVAIHLTLAHWPYAWAGMPVPTVPDAYRDTYGAAIAAVDRQFGAVMRLLGDKHVLDNAIVVLLSDHGEALGAETDSMLRATGTSREIWDSLWGHGTSVMSPHQYQVLLAMRAYGRAALPGPEQDYDWPVSLEDLRPTLEQFVTGRAPASVDGASLLPYMAEPASARGLMTRVRFTETDFNTPGTLAGDYEISGIIDEAAVFYEVDPASGWVQFREDRLPDLLARKQRAAISTTTLLAAIPGPPGQGPRYLLTDRQNPAPRTLEGPPDPTAEPEARRLWDALKARYPGELPADPELPRM